MPARESQLCSSTPRSSNLHFRCDTAALDTPFLFPALSMAVEMTNFHRFLLLSFFLVLSSTSAVNVTYDHRSLIIDGRRRLLISASIHYPRSVPSMWPGLVASAKEGGADVIETYVFWNGHELSPGNYSFEDRFDLLKFVNIVKDAGMYLILRIGPFVAAEWNFGGIPVWLHYIPGVVFRSNSEQFKSHMQSFMTYIVNIMKRDKLFASQGGPIILAQVENEYGDTEKVYGDGGKLYAMWAADMALSQDIGVPWIMCQQYDAPARVINTCNSFYCDQFVPNSPRKPKIWTENWPGWFQTFGTSNPHRPPEDIAFSVARFFQKGGSLQNYYMYHGGTNFGRTSGGPFITTSYDYDAPIDEYGLLRLPKWSHLKDLHKSIKLCEHALLYSEPTHLLIGPLQEVSVFADSSGSCAAFLANMDDTDEKWIVFQNRSYHLPAWSVSILPDCKTIAFNTAKVRSQISMVDMVPESLVASKTIQGKGSKGLQWHIYKEKTGSADKTDFVRHGFADHLNTTKDTTDYLWYSTSVISRTGVPSRADEEDDLSVWIRSRTGRRSRRGVIRLKCQVTKGTKETKIEEVGSVDRFDEDKGAPMSLVFRSRSDSSIGVEGGVFSNDSRSIEEKEGACSVAWVSPSVSFLEIVKETKRRVAIKSKLSLGADEGIVLVAFIHLQIREEWETG